MKHVSYHTLITYNFCYISFLLLFRNNRPNGSYSIENLLSQPPFASSSHFRASVKSSEYQNTESYIKPNEFLFSGGTINPWNYGALNMTDISRENAMPPIFPFLHHNPLGMN